MASLNSSELLDEYQDLDLGDARLNQRVRLILPRLASNPAQSFPEQMGTDGQREALYRFFQNPKVTIDALLEGHRAQTQRRMTGSPVVRIVHDTSDFMFKGQREGLPTVHKEAKGFSAHTCPPRWR